MQLSPINAVLIAMLFLAAGAVVSIALSVNRRLAGWFGFLVTATAGALALWAGASTIVHGPGEAAALPALSLWNSTPRFYLDGLGALFLCLIAVVSALSALYSVSYMDHYKEYHVGRYYPWFLVFLAGMYGIVIVTDTMLYFCLFWQLMTIPSYALIRFEYRVRENVRAANKYLLVMEIACLLIMAGSAIVAYTGQGGPEGASRFDFDVLRERIASGTVGSFALAAALLLMLLGFGAKAGVWPLGLIWLPDAHPAAPSPVSALLSGVMIKTGVYGLIRTFFWLVPTTASPGFSPAVWGGVLAVLGTVTLVAGTFQALRQEQSKRLLAFHSIGQIGYIILGLGAALMLVPHGAPASALAALALVGALFHTINHALFKSLLFFNAGTVLKATGTQDLNKLGGLMAFMPLTAATCLVASFSIAGVPLFNGFAGKWSIYAAGILGAKYAGILALCALLGILTSALTLASFMKFFGVTFLSRRSATVMERVSAGAKLEAGPLMQLPQLLLAAACVVLGVLPALGYLLLDKALAAGSQGISALLPRLGPGSGGLTAGLAAPDGGALFVPFIIIAALAALALGAHLLSRLGGAPRRAADVWLCGYDTEADVHRYGAHNLYGEVKHLFDRNHRRNGIQ